MAMSEYSLSDIAAASGGEGLGGNNALLWLVLIFAIFGFGGNGFGGRNDANATAAAQQEILYGQQFQTIRDKQDSTGDGICQLGYALGNEARQLQNQISSCCCDARLGIANLGAQMDKSTCTITNAIHAEGEATRALITQNEMQRLHDENCRLSNHLSVCEQNNYIRDTVAASNPRPIPSYQVPNPNCCYPTQFCSAK